MRKNTDGWAPIPDPTVLTTELTLREVSNLREFLLAKIEANASLDRDTRELIQSKIDANSNRIDLINKHLETRPFAIRDEVERLHALFDERFNSIKTQFFERDKRQDIITASDKTAISAALQSQKESMEKTETAFTKQLDQMSIFINALGKASDEKIDDLKTRLTLIEGKAKGIGEGWGIIVAAGGLATGILMAVFSYMR